MATKLVRTDDIDGSTATHSVSIIIGDVRYNLDLNDEHFTQFQTEMQPYTDAAEAKKVTQVATRKPAKKATSESVGKIVITMPDGTPVDRDAAREWAKTHGYERIGFFVGNTVLEDYRDWLVAGAKDPEPEEESDED